MDKVRAFFAANPVLAKAVEYPVVVVYVYGIVKGLKFLFATL